MDSSGCHLVAFLFAVICVHDVLLLRKFCFVSPALRHQLKESGLSFLVGTECGHFGRSAVSHGGRTRFFCSDVYSTNVLSFDLLCPLGDLLFQF